MFYSRASGTDGLIRGLSFTGADAVSPRIIFQRQRLVVLKQTHRLVIRLPLSQRCLVLQIGISLSGRRQCVRFHQMQVGCIGGLGQADIDIKLFSAQAVQRPACITQVRPERGHSVRFPLQRL